MLEQTVILYEALLVPLVGSPLPPEWEKEPFRMDRLTPGDFQVVRASRQSLFTAQSGVMHEELIAALRREVALKLENNNRAIGF